MSVKRPIELVESSVSAWNKLLLDLERDLLDDDLRKLKGLARDCIKQRAYEEIKNATELFHLLEKRGYIGENNVDYLRDLFNQGNLDVLNAQLDEYEKQHEKIKRRKMAISKRKGKNEFIGRQKEIDEITKLLWSETASADSPDSSACVCITGSPGTGKTELAMEVCARTEATAYIIELNGIKKSIDAFLKLFNEVLIPKSPIGREEYNSDFLQASIKELCQSHEKTILFDNADDIVAPDSSGSYKSQKEQFIEELKNLVNLRIEHGRVKFIVTSRFKVFEGRLIDDPRFAEYYLGNFTPYESILFLQKYSNPVDLNYFDAEDIAKGCKCNPLALKIVTSRLRMGNTSSREIIGLLSQKSTKMEVLGTGADNSGVHNALLLVFRNLEEKQLVELASLTLFAGSFNQNTAAAVMSVDRQVAKLHLQDLLNWNLIEKVMRVDFDKLGVKMEDDKNERYTIHLLVKTFLQQSGRDLIGGKGQEVFDKAEQAFVEGFGKELQSEARKSLRDNYAEGRFFLEKEKANLLEYVNLSKKLSIAPSVKHRKDQDRLLSLFTFMTDVLMRWQARAEYFHSMAENAEKSGNWLSYCFFKAIEAEQYFSVNDFQSVASIIGKPFEIIEKLMKEKGSSGTKLVQAELYYVKGRLTAETEKFPKGCDLLQKSFDTRQELYGTSTFTLRSLRALGYVYQSKGRQLDEALKYFKQSYQMAIEINQNLVHPDFPLLLLDIGNCYLEKGYDLTNEKRVDQAKGHYNLAIDYFARAIQSEKEMKIFSYTARTAKILRSKALAHVELGEYDPALVHALDSMHIRRTKCGFDHRDTAASTFLVGHIYYTRGIHTEMSKSASEETFDLALDYLKEAFRIEKNLGGRFHTNNYEPLKEDLLETLKRLDRKKEVIDNYRQEFEVADTLAPNTCPFRSLRPGTDSSPEMDKLELDSNRSTSTSASEEEST